MKTEITEQERQEIEEAAKWQAPTSDDAFFHYPDQDIWKEGFGFGAEFAERAEYVYHGYDCDGNILFEYLANTVNVTYTI